MIKVDVRVDIERVKRQLDGLRKEVNIAAATALNKTAVAARKVADQRIRQRFTLSSRGVKDHITIRRAGAGRLVAYITASGDPIPLRAYQARDTKRGVTYQVSKVRGRRLYLRKGQPAFIVERFGGHVFVRTEPEPPGPAKARIQKVYGPSLPQVFVTRAVRQAMLEAIHEVWPKRFKEEINFRTRVQR